MHVLVLSSRRSDNPYGDTDEVYVFPKAYLARFEPLTRGEAMLALIYEPRRGGGAQEYVAWAWLSQPPQARPDGQFEVRYDGKLIPLPRPCPLVGPAGVPFEVRLQAVPRARWGSALQGSSVRAIGAAEAAAILGEAGQLVDPLHLPGLPDAPPERATQLVLRSVRDRGFRAQVLAAYGYRCAVTGFSTPPAESRALLDAAHIRPVAQAGGDHVRNGLALSATLHRLYDGGLITAEYRGGRPELLTSPDLGNLGLTGPGGTLTLTPGLPLGLPVDSRAWPDPDALAWHRSQVFRG